MNTSVEEVRVNSRSPQKDSKKYTQNEVENFLASFDASNSVLHSFCLQFVDKLGGRNRSQEKSVKFQEIENKPTELREIKEKPMSKSSIDIGPQESKERLNARKLR